MNREAIRHHFDKNEYTYRETDSGFEVPDPTLETDTLLELGACEATVVHQEVGFEITE